MTLSFFKDISFSAVIAGFITVLVGFSSSGILVFQAAQDLGATPEQMSSWIWALGWGLGLSSIGLSLYYRTPIATAWSTAAAALLITSAASGTSLQEATGAFLMSAALIILCGFTGWFERIMNHVPISLASGMLAGILLRFGLDIFGAMKTHFLLVACMFGAYLLTRRLQPRYAVISALVIGITMAGAQGMLHFNHVQLKLAHPVFTMPQFSLHTFIGLALPLFMVTMASQNMPGVAVIRASGYKVPVSPIIGWTGIAAFVFAPFGAFTLNLAAITAAICMGREAHEDAAKRYIAAIAAGVFYIAIGLIGATVSAVFAAFPKELVSALAGIALLNTIGNGLATALKHEHEREPALITFLVTASGITLYGIGSAFWGLLAGGLSLIILNMGRQYPD